MNLGVGSRPAVLVCMLRLTAQGLQVSCSGKGFIQQSLASLVLWWVPSLLSFSRLSIRVCVSNWKFPEISLLGHKDLEWRSSCLPPPSWNAPSDRMGMLFVWTHTQLLEGLAVIQGLDSLAVYCLGGVHRLKFSQLL